MTIQTKTKAVRNAGLKVTATYLAITRALALAEMGITKYAHTWKVADDFHPQHAIAGDLLEDHQLNMPFAREHDGLFYGEKYQQGGTGWVYLSIPGVARIAQGHEVGDKYEFRFLTKADRTRFVEHVERLADEAREAEPVFNPQPTRRSLNIGTLDPKTKDWNFNRSRLGRTFDSVVLPSETQAAIEDDLKRFTESRARLQRVEMPWRRGYLLTGPPGTGKTSVSLAIAGSLGFNLASLSLTDVRTDGDLRKAVSELAASTVLVIEDIDAYAVSRDRDHGQADGALSLSGLLNALDGFETPEGLVTICTTNHVEQLDPALIRPGRLDRIFHLDYIAAAELERLFLWFYEQMPPTPAPASTLAAHLSPAAVADMFKQHLESPLDGWSAVLDRIKPADRLHLISA